MSKQNHLAQEASLYLRQHADNPVDWYPWNPKALAKAKQENKPILLSIGYSACHWCHVMANESFADPETAKVMNELYINIKVDREERPDLDKIYQTAHQMLTGRGGGWPLTVFLNPQNLAPFFAGTYFAPRAGFGRPSFKDLLKKVAEYYHKNPEAIAEQNNRITQALKQLVDARVATSGELTEQPLILGRRQLAAEFDPIHGGFGDAPKFPHPTNLDRLLAFWSNSLIQHHEDKTAFVMVETTLEKMADGGIYDQLGGGFFRYTVDAAWQIPHFEKMLYDNGLLLGVYALGCLLGRAAPNTLTRPSGHPLPQVGEGKANLKTLTRSESFIIEETANWLLREMHAPQGGFYATLDADSEHHEGKFYYWQREQIQNALTEEEYAIAVPYFGLNEEPNFEGHWHLHVACTLQDLAQKFNISDKDIAKHITTIKQKLLKAREQRVRPGRDEKILTAWNGLVIKGLALAGYALQQNNFVSAAQKAVDFIREHLWIDQRLYATYQEGRAQHTAYCDDYAFVLDALLTLLQVKWETKNLEFAIALADNLLNYFEDQTNGGFYFTASFQEQLIQRPKILADEAIPAGNGIAALALIRLGHLLGEDRYLKSGEKTLRMAWTALMDYPSGHCSLLNALEEYLHPPQIIILRGAESALAPWQQECTKNYAVRRLVFAIPDTEINLPGILQQQVAPKNKVTAFICSGRQCLEPVHELHDFIELLAQPF